MSKRLPQLGIASVIGIFLIVFGHAFISADFAESNPTWYRLAQKAAYQFHIHLFFFISGYLVLYATQFRPFGFGTFLQKRFLRLMVPYLFFMFLNLGPNLFFDNFAAYPVEEPMDVLHLLIYPKDNTIKYHWFLYTLFALSIFTPLGIQACRHPVAMIILTGLLLAAFILVPKHVYQMFNFSAWPQFGWYYWLGMVCCKVQPHILARWKASFAAPITLILTVTLVTAFILLNHTMPSNLGKAPVTLAYSAFALLGISWVFALSAWYVHSGSRFLSCFEGKTMTIFLLSWYGHKGVDMILNKGLNLGFYWVFPVSILAGLFIPLIAYKIFAHRHPILDCILGIQPS